jgi:pimeloyl-ACP methyl ester carboxylesterase
VFIVFFCLVVAVVIMCRYREVVPQPDVVLLADGIGHYPQLEAPGETMAAYAAFLASLPAA